MSLTYKFVLRTHKHLKNGEHEIMLRITKFRKTSFISIKKSSRKEHWDTKSSRVKPQHPNEEDINATISNINSRIARLKLDSKIANRDITVEDIRKQVDDSNLKEVPRFTVFEYFDNYIERLEKQDKLGSRDIYYYTKCSLSKYTNAKDYFFTQINYEFLGKYIEYLRTRKVMDNTISVYMRTFRTLWRNAIKEEICPPDHYPFLKVNFGEFNKETAKRAISKEKIYEMIELDLEPNSEIWHARNYFLFSYYCSGINLVDMVYLKNTNIIDGRLHYTRMKTGEMYSIKIFKQIQEILDIYIKNPKKSDAGYIFPFLYKRHKTIESKRNRYKKISKEINKNLKTIGLLLGINKKITFYVARHALFSNLFQKGTPIDVIGQIAHHKDPKTTKIYIENLNEKVIDDIIEQAV